MPDTYNTARRKNSRSKKTGTPSQSSLNKEFWFRENSDFLPVAYIVGLQPGIAVQVPIVVVAEDGVTSNRSSPLPTSLVPVTSRGRLGFISIDVNQT